MPVTRLATVIDVREATPERRSYALRHYAVLGDGERVLLLDDRGWTQSPGGSSHPDWEKLVRTARFVVGPDEPAPGSSQEDARRAHLAHLAALLRARGVTVDGAELGRLPHEVVRGAGFGAG